MYLVILPVKSTEIIPGPVSKEPILLGFSLFQNVYLAKKEDSMYIYSLYFWRVGPRTRDYYTFLYFAKYT